MLLQPDWHWLVFLLRLKAKGELTFSGIFADGRDAVCDEKPPFVGGRRVKKKNCFKKGLAESG